MSAASAIAASYDHVASRSVIEPVLRLYRVAGPGTSLELSAWEVRRSIGLHAPEVLRPAMERLAELAVLEEDWDSYGGFPPSLVALAKAEAMMRTVVERFGGAVEDAVPGAIMPIADGGIQLEWRGADVELALNAAPDGTWSYLLIRHGPEGRTFEEAYGLTDADALALVFRVLGA
jgi:hypothetical protein